MRFLSLLRVLPGESRRAPDPMEPGFDEEVFHQAFMTNNDGSPEDFHARNFGVLIATRARRLFLTLEDLERRSRRSSHNDMVKAVACFAHSQQLALFSDYRKELANVKEITQEALITLRTATDGRGNTFRPDEVLDTIIDGARHLLRRVGEGNGFGEADNYPETDDIDAVVSKILSLGTGLEMLRRQWHSVLWGGAKVYVDTRPPNPYVIDKTVSALEQMASVDLQRRQVTIGRDTNELKEFFIRRLLNGKRVLRYEKGRSDAQRLVVTTIDALPDEQRRVALEIGVAHAAQINQHVEFFLDKSHSSLKGVTFRKVLHAWYCIALLVHEDYSQAETDSSSFGCHSKSRVTCLQTAQLNVALCEALDILPSQAKAVISFLVYQGKHQTLWARPLLDTKDGLLPMWWPFQCGHLMRLVASWGTADKDVGAKFSDKGHRYEEMVHLLLAKLASARGSAVRYLPLGPRLAVPEKAADGKDVGDVDAAFIVDQTLFILECRAVAYPAEAFEFWSVHNELNQKIHQVLRKRDHLVSNPGVVTSWVTQAYPAAAPPNIEKVVALVVSNSFLLEGERAEEPYFVHTDTLYNVLLTGHSAFGGGFDENGHEVEFHVDFREEGVTDAEVLLKALKQSPKAEAYKACVTAIDTKVPGFDDSDATGVIRSPAIAMPMHGHDVEALLLRCSFARHIRRVKAP